MLTLTAIALRNLLRARRRSLLSGGTMALGTAALVLGNGLADGIARQLTANLVAVQTGHLQVVARPRDFEPQNSPFDAYSSARLPGAEALARRIEAASEASGVVRAAALLYGRGTAMAGGRSSMAGIIGIEPEREPELRAAHRLQAGSFLSPTGIAGGAPEVFLASPLAQKLRVGVGDAISFVVQTPEGAINSLDGVVCGVFEKAAPWYDHALYVNLRTAQDLFAWPGDATSIKITVAAASQAAAERARPAIQSVVQTSLTGLADDHKLRVETFPEAGRFAFSIMEANRGALFILSSFLLAAAAVGIVNSMLMSVHERTREIGTVRALGMRRGAVIRLFVLEGFALGAAAAGLGILAGGGVVLHYAAHGIPMNTTTLTWMAGGDRLFTALTATSVVSAAAIIVGLSTLAAVYPAYVASRLEPREALHHV